VCRLGTQSQRPPREDPWFVIIHIKSSNHIATSNPHFEHGELVAYSLTVGGPRPEMGNSECALRRCATRYGVKRSRIEHLGLFPKKKTAGWLCVNERRPITVEGRPAGNKNGDSRHLILLGGLTSASRPNRRSESQIDSSSLAIYSSLQCGTILQNRLRFRSPRTSPPSFSSRPAC